jgi:uncharacterized membrane protein
MKSMLPRTHSYPPAVDRNGMKSFQKMQQKMLMNSFRFATIGAGVAAMVKGLDGVAVFTYGSAIGLTNQWLLQSEVENIGSIKNILQVLNNTATRLALSVSILYITYLLLGEHIETWQVGGAYTGFLMNKLGMIHGYLTEELGPEHIQDDDRGLD